MAKFEAGMESMLDTFVFETSSLLEELDEILMRTEKDELGADDIAEIFRVMHTTKGSAAMMGLTNMSKLAHSVEDLFFIIREDPTVQYDKPAMYELLFSASDSLKNEIDVIQDDSQELTDFTGLMGKIHGFANVMKGAPEENSSATADIDMNVLFPEDESPEVITAKVTFDEECMMPTIRAMILVKSLGDIAEVCGTYPADIDDDTAGPQIMKNGLFIKFCTDDTPTVLNTLKNGINVITAELFTKPEKPAAPPPAEVKKSEPAPSSAKKANENLPKKAGGDKASSIISVKLEKLDRLLDLVAEIVITESSVTSNPDLKKVTTNLDRFQKSSRELKKLTDELQDVVMSIRMVPVSSAFTKMSRVIRDMNQKLKKNVELVFEGEETEVDKSIVDILNDPLMHIVRNAVDHGIEDPEVRAEAGKTEQPKVVLSACYDSGEVVISCADNGAGMDRNKLLAKAKKNGILTKPESEYTDSECYNFVMAAGFSTNEKITEFSGRGVGMDVVRKNIESVGGKIRVDSEFGKGSTFTIKIPLSLSIIDVMGIDVGDYNFSVPISSIREAFKADNADIIAEGANELIMRRGECIPVYRFSTLFDIEARVNDFSQGIMLLCQEQGKHACFFGDKLTSDQQVVVKPFSPLLSKYHLKEHGMSGCSILADGSITLTLDMKELFNGIGEVTGNGGN